MRDEISSEFLGSHSLKKFGVLITKLYPSDSGPLFLVGPFCFQQRDEMRLKELPEISGLCFSNPSSIATTKLLFINFFSFESSLFQTLSPLRTDLNIAEITRAALPQCIGGDHKC
jgi:hypothetical protein